MLTVRDCSQGVSRFLDRAGAADRAAIKAHAQQAQYDEYDDEYDDSYDDLGGPSADGVADVEGDYLSCDARSLHPAVPGQGCMYVSTPAMALLEHVSYHISHVCGILTGPVRCVGHQEQHL